MTALFFCIFLMATTTETEFPYAHISFDCSPKLFVGDTLYIKIEAANPYDKSIFLSHDFWPTDLDIQTSLTDKNEQTVRLLFEYPTNRQVQRELIFSEILPGEKRIIGALAISLPTLEDIENPFWKKQIENLPVKGDDFTLKIAVWFQPSDEEYSAKDFKSKTFRLEKKITIQPRPKPEMDMIFQWYRITPKELFPCSQGSQSKTPPIGYDSPPSGTVKIAAKNQEHSLWDFVRIGNRYPGPQNVPENWQGWLELEKCLVPSTMRDEIRLTRFLIQYCDTENESVLTELKTWFGSLNEIQRIVMAKNVRILANSTVGRELEKPYKKICAALEEYDVAK